MWATCVYVEAVSVLPQLRMMQNAKVVEKFTAHYVFALGLSRFISCAHWILQIIDGDSFLLQVGGHISTDRHFQRMDWILWGCREGFELQLGLGD